MGMIDAMKKFLTLEPMQERTIVDPFTPAPDLDAQIAALWVRQARSRPWRVASITDAIGVPAVYRAVTLIANTTGALSLEAYRRDGTKLDNNARPRIIVRPNPFSTPRDFFRDTSYSMATRGEAWWWVAKRDADGSAMSLLPVAPAEVSVTEDERDLRYPRIEWRGKKMRNEDMVQITLAKEPGGLRGIGPLQMCGAAISVAVESQEWAANFFASGGYPSVVLKSEVDMTDAEAAALRAQWAETPPNMPRVTTPNYSIEEFGANPQGAQMLQARDYQVGDVARMFGIPASLLDHQSPGSSLTYQNLEGEFGKFVRACLWPNYLEAIEQAISDLLTRSTVARFNVDALLRSDVKTRYEVYASGVASGVLTTEEAREIEGLAPGDVENAPVPFAPPQAIPASLPIERSAEVRCPSGHLLAELATPPYRFTCPKCKKVASADGVILTRSDDNGLRELAAAVGVLATREAPAPIINNYTTVESPPPAQAEGEEVKLFRRAVVAMERPAEPPNVTVNVPPAENHVHVEQPAPAVVNVAPAAVNVERTVINVAGPEIAIPPAPLVRSVIDRDPDTGKPIGSHQELI